MCAAATMIPVLSPLLYRLILLQLLATGVAWAAESDSLKVRRFEGLVTTLHTQQTGERWARLEIATMVPVRQRIGFARAATPRPAPRGVTLQLFDVRADADDWTALAELLAARPSSIETPTQYRSPDGRRHRLLDLPRPDGEDRLTAPLAGPSGAPQRRVVVSLGPDGQIVTQIELATPQHR